MEPLHNLDHLSVAQKDDLIRALFAQVAALTAKVAELEGRLALKQSKALNLLDRLRVHADDVWRFMTDHGVPFSNNIAERDVRMPKVKQKISGGFRTLSGLDTFCTIRSYLATLHKQGDNLFHALTLAFHGSPPQLRFA